MKKLSLVLLAILGGLAGGWFGGGVRVHAQTTAIPAQLTVVGTHTQCTANPATTPAHADICAAGDGVWVSINGAAFAQLGAGASGVTSFNGRTGAVVSAGNDYSFSQLSGTASTSQLPAPPVSSVNGKTGAVVITAATTLQ